MCLSTRDHIIKTFKRCFFVFCFFLIFIFISFFFNKNPQYNSHSSSVSLHSQAGSQVQSIQISTLVIGLYKYINTAKGDIQIFHTVWSFLIKKVYYRVPDLIENVSPIIG